MAANQRRKRLSSASVVGYSSREPYRVRKKNLALPHSDANLRSHITLVWDGSKRRVVSKREQIGISWRKLRPFVDSVSNEQTILADIFDVPRQIFELEDLSEVLSLEVWQTHLSENERNNLRKFLPGEQENEIDVLGALFSGNNFHFGNPLVQWESSLCSGALHPDAVLHHEQCLRADKKTYSRELQKYHNNMIGYLQKLKDRCANCKDPEKEIIHQTWRMYNEGYKRERCRNSSSALDDMLNVGTRTEDKLQKRNIQCSDGSKYMSYLKISKKQHDLVKNMKQSGSLDQVLGDIQAFNVQPYQVFIEEEQKKLHEHWLQLSKVHLPVAYANWRQIHLQRRQIIKALEQDLKDRQTQLMDVDTESHDSMLRGQMDAEETDQMDMEETGNESTEKSISGSQSSQSSEQGNGGLESDSSSNPKNHDASSSGDTNLKESGISRNMDAIECSARQGEALLSIGDVRPGPGIQNNYYSSSTSHDYAASISNLSLANSHADDEQKTKVFNVDPDMHVRGVAKSLLHSQSDDDTCVKHGLHGTDIGKILLPRQSDNGAFVEPDLHGRDIGKSSLHRRSDVDTFTYENEGKDIGKTLLHRQPEDGTFSSYEDQGKDIGKHLLHRLSDDGVFSYENQGKDELLHSVFKRQGAMSFHHHKERHSCLDFQPSNNDLIEESQYSRHFQEQPNLSIPLQQRQKEDDQVYIQHAVPENIYPDGNRYLIPPTQQQLLPSVGMQDWTANSVRLSSHIHSHSHPVNGGRLLSENWFSSEHQVRDGFTGSDGVSVIVPNPSIGSGSNSADQTLFSVLSQGNQFRSPFHSMGSNGQFISPRNYGMLREGNPMIGNILPETSNPINNYLGGHEIASQGMSWVGMRHQSSNLTDPMEKPYLRSWNQ